MNDLQRGLIILIKSALKGEEHKLPESFSLEAVVDVAKNHQISPLVYYGAIKCGFDKTSDAMKKLFENAFPLVMLDEMQIAALCELSDGFEKSGIEYMPLKGSVLKALYPKSEMRVMGDVDILIKQDQYEKISGIMQSEGYEFQYESNHEFVWKKENVLIEIHKSVMTSYNKDFFSYFSNGWNLAERKSDAFKYEMSDENFFLYMFVHFTKHYRVSGIGIKHLTDLWVYKNAKPELDFAYIKNELRKLCLDKFFEYVEKTMDNWFENGEETLETKLISDTVFGSGVYGNKETAEVSTMLRETKDGKSVGGKKLSRFFKVVFLPYKNMCEKYVMLRKFPFLLPVMWIVRLFDILIFNRKKLSSYVEKQKTITKDAVKSRREELNSVGLDFNSEEDIL